MFLSADSGTSSVSRGQAKTFLIVCFRNMGDVIVTTPLAKAIKEAIPDAVVDYLVFAGTEGMLLKNPHVRQLFTARKGKKNIGLLWSLFRKYDVALAAYASDRTTIAAFVAGKRSFGFSWKGGKDWWKQLLLSGSVHYNHDRHVVHNIGALLPLLGINARLEMSMGFDEDDAAFAQDVVPAGSYVVFHPYSSMSCKNWPAERWGALASLVAEHLHCTPVFTSSPLAEDQAYRGAIMALAPPKTSFLPPCSLTQLAAIINGCAAFVGVDTGITHMAAALGVPVVALYGPTLTRYWAPWPMGIDNRSPFDGCGIQRVANVTVVQKDWDCVSCNKLSCDRSQDGGMPCMEDIREDEVFQELHRLVPTESGG